MGKLPYIQWFVGDYIKDTRGLTLVEKGAWSDLLFHMHVKNQCGLVQGTWEDISLIIGANDVAKCKQIFVSIFKKEVCNLIIHNPNQDPFEETVSIINRRMYEKFLISQKKAENGKKGGEKTAANSKQNLNNDSSNDQANVKRAFEYEIENDNEFKIEFENEITEKLKSHPGFLIAWGKWEQHRKEIKHKLTPKSVEQQLEKLSKSKYPTGWILGVIEKGWRGIYPIPEKEMMELETRSINGSNDDYDNLPGRQ